jgi:hypothetical protein
MPTESAEEVDCTQSLQEVLLEYLTAAHLPKWLGTDGLTLRDIVRSYPQAMAAGQVPTRKELLRKHPDLNEALQAFFASISIRWPPPP